MTIEIDRLQLHLRATAAPQRLHALECRVREALVTALPAALVGFDRSMGGDDADAAENPLVFIDRLEFTTALNSAWDDKTLGQATARPLSTRIRTLIEQGGEGVRHFKDRAAWIAEFMHELANGTAWRRWWFDAFDGLRPLALPAALRTVILDEGETGITALLRLPQAELARVVNALASTECQRVLMRWGERQATVKLPLHRLWQAALSISGKGATGVVHAALTLQRDTAGCIDARTLALLKALEALWRHTDDTQPSPDDSRTPTLDRHCAAAGIGNAWRVHLDANETADLEALLRDSRQAKSPAHDTPDQAAGDSSGGAAAWHARTEHGGAFVILVVMSWLRWEATWQRAFTDHAGTEAIAPVLARTLALAVIARALLPADPETVARDPALLHVWGITGTLQCPSEHSRAMQKAIESTGSRPKRVHRKGRNGGALETWLQAAAQDLLTAMSDRIPGCAKATHDYLRRNLLAASAGIASAADGTALEVTMTRPPLHVLLLIAGLAQGQVWLGARQLRLRTEDAS